MNSDTHLDHSRIPEQVHVIRRTLVDAGFQAFLVGGAVRDLVRGAEPAGWDMCTDALAGEIEELFPLTRGGGRHGAVTVFAKGPDVPVGVATFRGGDVETDVLRRDSTMNGLLWNGVKVVDLVGGIADLRNGLVRAVGSADDRIGEEPVRMLRYVRQSARMGMRVAAGTSEAILRNAHLLAGVPAEAVFGEITGAITGPDPAAGVATLMDHGLLRVCLPEVHALDGLDQHSGHHDMDALGHTLAVLGAVPADPVLRWAALLHDIGKPATFSVGEDGIGHFYGHHRAGARMALAVMQRLGCDDALAEDVRVLVRYHMARYRSLRPAPMERFLARVGESRVDRLFQLMAADVFGHRPPHDVRGILGMYADVRRAMEAGHDYAGALAQLRETASVQCSDGNWDYDPYMHGMANGLIFALSLFGDGHPDYLEAPVRWLKDVDIPSVATAGPTEHAERGAR